MYTKYMLKAILILFFIMGYNMNCAQDMRTTIYHIDKHVSSLCAFDKMKENILLVIPKNTQANLQIFNHALTYWCEKMVLKEGNIDALFDTWKMFKTHAIEDGESFIFIREFSILLFMLYQSIFYVHFHMTPDELCALYEQVIKFPLEKIMVLLDQSLDRVALMLEEHALMDISKGIRFLQKHWKISSCAVVLACILLSPTVTKKKSTCMCNSRE